MRVCGFHKRHGKVIFIKIFCLMFLAGCGGGGGSSPGNTNTTPPASSDTTPPAPVTGLSAVADVLGNAINISWNNPVDIDFSGVIIVRSLITNPTSISDGSTVFTGVNNSYSDSGLVNGKTYFYSIFSFDDVPNYSTASSISASPIRLISRWNISIWDTTNSVFELPSPSGVWGEAVFQ